MDVVQLKSLQVQAPLSPYSHGLRAEQQIIAADYRRRVEQVTCRVDVEIMTRPVDKSSCFAAGRCSPNQRQTLN